MKPRAIPLALLAVACPLLQGCLTQFLWKNHHRQPVDYACDAVVVAASAQVAHDEDGQAVLLLRYRLVPGPDAAPSPDAPLPAPEGCIAFRAHETQVQEALEALVGSDDGTQPTGGLLFATCDGNTPAATLSFSVSVDPPDALPKGEGMRLEGTWALAEASEADGDLVSLAWPVPLRVVDRRLESDTLLLVMLTPLTVAADISGAVLLVCSVPGMILTPNGGSIILSLR